MLVTPNRGPGYTAAVTAQAQFGLGKGKVYPHQKAGSLLNPVRRLIQSPERLARSIGMGGEESVLELGCGPGYFSRALADSVPRGTLTLFDLQPEMLNMARERLGSRSTITAVVGDAMMLPFNAAAFDIVFIALVLGEVPDRRRCLEEVRRTLRPGGWLVINEVRGDPDFIKPARLDEECGEAGLRLLRRRLGRLRWTHISEYVIA